MDSKFEPGPTTPVDEAIEEAERTLNEQPNSGPDETINLREQLADLNTREDRLREYFTVRADELREQLAALDDEVIHVHIDPNKPPCPPFAPWA